MKRNNTVLSFINKFKFNYKNEIEYIFSYGNCYYFALILSDRFKGEIYYLPISNHFVCKIDNDFYDIKGYAKINEKPYKLSQYQAFDKNDFMRISRDCIDFETR